VIRFINARLPMGRDRRLLIPDWTLSSGELWVIAGAGGTGKTTLARIIAGAADSSGYSPHYSGVFREPKQTGAWISFDREREIRNILRRDDDSEFLGRPDEGTTVEYFLDVPDGYRFINPELLEKIRDRGIRNLSTGEFRQVLIAREAGMKPALAVLDEPFEGLDITARPRLMEQLSEWSGTDTLIVLTVNRLEDIPPFATGLALLDDDRLAAAGRPSEILKSALALSMFNAGQNALQGHRIPPPPVPIEILGKNLIEMKDVSLAYSGRTVLETVNWSVDAGESWLLTGPNGSGKTTLMNLISGDEPRGYGQNLRLFGKQKGSGEATSEIKSRIGQVSSILQEAAPRHADLVEIVGSGLRESMVLTSPLDGFETGLVNHWLDLLGLSEKKGMPFFRLSYGDRRMAMIGRAMIKHPPLLLLDEPMHGLDTEARIRISNLVEFLIEHTQTTVLFVSHRPDDAPQSITNHIRLVPEPGGGPSKAVIGRREFQPGISPTLSRI
jgi:molybdate transport system ATP-binding protein